MLVNAEPGTTQKIGDSQVQSLGNSAQDLQRGIALLGLKPDKVGLRDSGRGGETRERESGLLALTTQA